MAIADVLAAHRSGGNLGRAPRRRDVHPVRAVMLPLEVMDAEVTTAGEDWPGREFR
ncbi:hypothetical protein [Streptomyces sp. NPDC054961]